MVASVVDGRTAKHITCTQEIVRESIPRQIDKKSGVPEEERGVWGSSGGERDLEFSRRRKGPTFLLLLLFPTYLSLSHVKYFVFIFFPLSPELMIAQQKYFNSVLRII